jgi:hypothetical protein
MNDPSVAMSFEDAAQTRASPRRALLFTGFAWLSIAVIALRFTYAPVTTDVVAFLAAAVAGFLAHLVAGRSEQGARAAAAAAVNCLRLPDLQLTSADQDELLATAEESLSVLSRLAATLLDVTRLQAGARPSGPVHP